MANLKLIIAAIKSLLTPLKRSIVWNAFRAPRLWEKNEFLYHNNKEPLNPLHNFFCFSSNPQDVEKAEDERKKILSGFFLSSLPQSFLLQQQDFWSCKKRAALLTDIKTWSQRRRVQAMIINKTHGTEHKAFPRKKWTKNRIVLCR